MIVLVLVTYTDCENKWRSLQSVGYDVRTLQYDNVHHDQQGEIIQRIKMIKPDAIVYIGAVERYHHRPVLTIDSLKKVREIAPFIHMCNDASDSPWWEWINKYYAYECFDLQVSIDGSYNTPISQHERGMVLLTPIDHRVFKPDPWRFKDIRCGMVGGIGHTHREEAIGHLRATGHLKFFEGPGGRSYEQMANLMARFKIGFNFPMNGTGNGAHVKGRLVETGFAHAVPLEMRSSPAGLWFTEGEEYLGFYNLDEAKRQIDETSDDKLEAMATKFREHVLREHHPKVFWKKVMNKVGFKDEVLPHS